jgi:ribosomal protein S18 acetylase RimI-like enzyme
MNITIKPLSEALIPDFLNFFDNIAFTDNPEWSGCYCYYYHESCPPDQWMKRGAAANREDAQKLIQAGTLRGYLAFDPSTNQPMGWINVNDKGNYPRLATNPDFIDTDSGTVGLKIAAIVCYVIAPNYRRQGIATQLLARAIADYTGQGYDYLEAYPAKGAKTDAHLYHGPVPMYEEAGFTIYRELKNFDILRKKLKK